MAYFFPPHLMRLRSFLGANGIRTSALRDPADVITTTAKLFALDDTTGMDDAESLTLMERLQEHVAAIPYADRRILVRRNLQTMPHEIVSRAPANKGKRTGRMQARDRKRLERGGYLLPVGR